jgi:hypothetical protein
LQLGEGGYLRRSGSGRRLLRNPILTCSRGLRRCRCLSLLVLYVAVTVLAGSKRLAIFHIKQWLAIFDGETCHRNHRTRPQRIVVQGYVVAEDLGFLFFNSLMWWRNTWERIPQFFSRPFSVPCRTFTLPCIACFSLRFATFCGHFILSAFGQRTRCRPRRAYK